MIRKPAPAKTISRHVLTEWVENVTSQLNTIEMQKIIEPDVSSLIIVNHGGFLEVLLPDHNRMKQGTSTVDLGGLGYTETGTHG
ncbi:hypothetical protein V6N12_025551 [Hibiscus sabdariffa]|uniref:Uncharacterized protein n=1 Tax=Hibiscus sabdariffa TaxID=183260 RepID=A0ABR2CIT1_9ROSI